MNEITKNKQKCWHREKKKKKRKKKKKEKNSGKSFGSCSIHALCYLIPFEIDTIW